jgi:hypothetical protein
MRDKLKNKVLARGGKISLLHSYQLRKSTRGFLHRKRRRFELDDFSPSLDEFNRQLH